MKDGVTRIAQERIRQKQEKQWTREHDLQYRDEELRIAAAVYAMPPRFREIEVIASKVGEGESQKLTTRKLKDYMWPWKSEWYKPNKENPTRDLEKAGALIAAELDRRVETVRSAAIYIEDGREHPHQPKNIDRGIVFSGHRHPQCIANANASGLRPPEFSWTQGFITSKNRFVDRKEAAKIAYQAGQIYTPKGKLYSEDLY